MKNLRTIASYPFFMFGILGLKFAEWVKGEKYTYRANEVLEIYKTKAICSECGHEGMLRKRKL